MHLEWTAPDGQNVTGNQVDKSLLKKDWCEQEIKFYTFA